MTSTKANEIRIFSLDSLKGPARGQSDEQKTALATVVEIWPAKPARQHLAAERLNRIRRPKTNAH